MKWRPFSLRKPKSTLRLVGKFAFACLLLVVSLTSVGQDTVKVETEQDPAWLPQIAFRQWDVDGDDKPDAASITTQYITDADQITVYDQGGNMSRSTHWQDGTDFVDDAWLFHGEDDQQVKLIILFSRVGGRYRAELYDDVNGNSTVAYELHKQRVVVTESSFPTAIVTADAPWLDANGKVNPLIRIERYRKVEGTTRVFVPFPEDGRMLTEYEVVDLDKNGTPDYEYYFAYPDIPDDWLFERTGMRILFEEWQPPSFVDYFFWPYLGKAGTQQSDGVTGNAPLILFDWTTGQLSSINHLIPLWGHKRININSFTPMRKDQNNLLGFERFGHYLYSGHDLPNMIIRWSLGQNDLMPSYRFGDEIYYSYQAAISWQRPEHANSLLMDYKIELAGAKQQPDTLLKLPDFSLYEIPYEEWPAYFTSQGWAYATFIAAEDASYQTNEGLYEWNVVEGAVYDTTRQIGYPSASTSQTSYLFGFTDQSPVKQYTEIRDGFRGEYADLRERQPQLYLSAIDRKLHLLHAAHGVWSLSDTHEIRYESQGQQDTFLRWTLQTRADTARVVSSMYAPPDYLILADSQGVAVKAHAMPAALYYGVPPRNTQDWHDFNAQVAQHQDEQMFAPDDFRAMITQFGEPDLEIAGAMVEHFRPTEEGFRFELKVVDPVKAQINLNANSTITGLTTLRRGSYLVRAKGKTVSIETLTKPKLILADNALIVGDLQLIENQEVHLQQRVLNQGKQDAIQIPLRVFAQKGTDRTLVSATVIDIPGEDAITVTIPWVPGAGGDWTIETELGEAAWGQTISRSVGIPGVVTLKTDQVFALSDNLPMQGIFVATFLAALSLGVCTLFILISRYYVDEAR